MAQGTATIRATVSDASQAAIPGAKVVVANQSTGLTRESGLSSDGIFSVSSLPPGPYSVSAEAQGFKRGTGTLELQTGQTAVVDALMQVGSVDTVVEVTGAALVITAESSEIGDVKDALRIRQLPLNGR